MATTWPQQTRRGERASSQAATPPGTNASRDGPSFGSFHLGVAMASITWFSTLADAAANAVPVTVREGFSEQRMVLTTGGDGSGGGGPNDQNAQTGL